MNRTTLLSVVGVAILCVSPLFCSQYIDSGNVGVKVSSYGTNRGVNPHPIGTGRAFFNPLTTIIHEFPTSEQTITYDSIQFSSGQGAQITANIGVTFKIDEEQCPEMFLQLRRDIDIIKNEWLKNHVRDEIGRASISMKTMEILGYDRSKLLESATANLNTLLADYGIKIKTLSFASSPTPEAKIQASIDASIAADQLAKQAENKVAQSKAEADQKIEDARGIAESTKLQSLADLAAAENKAKGNLVLAKSLTAELIQYTAIQKWSGTPPQFMGSMPTPFINIDSEIKPAPAGLPVAGR